MEKEIKEKSTTDSSSAITDSENNSSLNSIITKFLRKSVDGREEASVAIGNTTSFESTTQESQKYSIGGRLAKGGMGAILNARDLQIKRDVAMKVLLDKKKRRENNVIRFIEEAQITGQLEHPGIVPVYELGVNEESEVYYTMKYIKGVTLKQIIREIRSGNVEFIREFPLTKYTSEGV